MSATMKKNTTPSTKEYVEMMKFILENPEFVKALENAKTLENKEMKEMKECIVAIKAMAKEKREKRMAELEKNLREAFGETDERMYPRK